MAICHYYSQAIRSGYVDYFQEELLEEEFQNQQAWSVAMNIEIWGYGSGYICHKIVPMAFGSYCRTRLGWELGDN